MASCSRAWHRPASLLHRAFILPPRAIRPQLGFHSSSSTHSQSSSGLAFKRPSLTWQPIPIWLGSSLLVFLVYLKKREKHHDQEDGHPHGTSDVKIEGPWQVHVLGALPLKSLSRLYGHFNNLTLPVWFRVMGFKLYSWIFNVNLDEIEIQDLKQFQSLNEFFYRKLRTDCRPIDQHSILTSPADGTIINFGRIEGDRRVASVKGLSYSVDALLIGKSSRRPAANEASGESSVSDSEFANINDIPYSVDQLMGSPSTSNGDSGHPKETTPVAGSNSVSKTLKVTSEVTSGALEREFPKQGLEMFFFVVYLSPGDYHRFHSPVDWIVERRRHFPGELFSVSPWMASKLPDLFVLNERVALLGRWKYGFFSMTPVGATNVGSIIINFDRDLRTNVPNRNRYEEVIYRPKMPSTLLGPGWEGRGQIIEKGEEMGGFSLGSTIVLIFEAPPEKFQFLVKKGDTIKYGEGVGQIQD